MSEDWKCVGCGYEIMADDNTYSFDGKTWHSWCRQKMEKEKLKEKK